MMRRGEFRTFLDLWEGNIGIQKMKWKGRERRKKV